LTITRELNIIKRGHTALELRGHFGSGITEVDLSKKSFPSLCSELADLTAGSSE